MLILSVAVCCASSAGEPVAPPPPKETPPAAPVVEPPVSAPDVVEQQLTVTASPIIEAASRIPTPASQTGVTVTVIDGKEDRVIKQNVTLAESLRDVPGLIVARSGLAGDAVSLFTRGGESDHTLFLYDGFKVNRHGGFFDLNSLDPVQLDRVEIARGPGSSLFGSDAVTGAINIVTAKGEGRPELTTSFAAGSYQTDRETLSVQGSEKNFAYSVGASHLRRDHAMSANSEAELYNFAGRFDYAINCEHELKMIFRGTDFIKGQYENSSSGYGTAVEPADPNDTLANRDLLLGFQYKGKILPIWDMTVKVGHYGFELEQNSRAPNPESRLIPGFSQPTGRSVTKEKRPMAEWQNDITAYQSECEKIKYIITVGASIEGNSIEQKDTIFGNTLDRDQTNWSIFTQHRVELFERAFLTAGVRREENGQFGTFTTARGDAAFLIPESDTRIHGSAGNAFRAPSFSELFSPGFGNRGLNPEENFGYDVGIDQNFWCKRITVGATWFENSFDNLISGFFDVNTNVFSLQNINTAHSKGLEMYAQFKPIKQLTLRGTGTLLKTEDDVGNDLLRRPDRVFTATAIANPIENLDLSMDLLYTGRRVDLGPTAANPFGRVELGGHTRVDAAASYRFLKHFRAFGRVENIFNKSYEEVKTFRSPGSTVLAGLEFSWRF